ncbi:hypothetical protein GWA97_10730 [Flavobacterium sp. LaA7.5]|nr:hypothetical protein [Flavobacterium salilacus subsp. altitudinum]
MKTLLKSLTFFLAKSLYYLHVGGFFVKIWSATKLSVAVGIPTWFLSKVTGWGVSNSDYIAGVLTCIAIDHVIGSYYHAFKINDFTIKKNAVGLITKLSLCAGAAILFEIIHNVVKEATLIYDYLKIVTRLIVILYPAGSAFMNMSALTNGVFPPLGWITKIKAFNKDLDLERFTYNNNNGQNNN